ncbi:hypothetical protein [Frateuria aurantia]|uniref:Lipoprotein n=1 Tax=Frateuria aurantia (strain ATCC 33424 / DSM 6220 / KCTC 2777 / LMG 1558 / NBRC 3245 / NCIMB 13370) TaxID=767434 RepID=H8L2E0_FRAAD|nr:hypothetical protein [Frateuria aurantia]AFC84774.1 hypothetical protein Fraau_0281 [Frateuria aurantia DSM 6220]
MKSLLYVAVAIALAGCSINRGFSDQLPRLNSPSAKTVAEYGRCLTDKWGALGGHVQTKTEKKSDVLYVYADDGKAGLRDRANITVGFTGTGSQVLLYEIQSHRPLEMKYRTAAISCL